jgi:NADP-reducing hydrogenase subunit HndA
MKTLEDIIAKHKGEKGSLIPVLHDIQELYGYIPEEVQKKVAEALNIPLSQVYGVITFYNNFSTQPKGKYKIAVCMGTACYVKGAGEILERFKEKLGIDVGECMKDGMFSLEECRCLGACGLAPALTINGKVYGGLVRKDADDIIEKYKNM